MSAIRPATAADAAAIAAIWNPLIRDTAITFNAAEKSPDDLAALIDARAAAGHAFLVAEQGGAIAGFATYAPFRAGVGYVRTMEHTIILAEAARGRGLGRTLLGAIEGHAQGRGAHSLIACVSAENPPARAFHAAMGYAQVAVLAQVGWKFGRWMDLLLMQKMLD